MKYYDNTDDDNGDNASKSWSKFAGLYKLKTARVSTGRFGLYRLVGMPNDMCSPEIDELKPNSLRSRGAVGLTGDVLVRAKVVDA